VPIVTIEWYVGRSAEQKRELAERLTQLIVEVGRTEPDVELVEQHRLEALDRGSIAVGRHHHGLPQGLADLDPRLRRRGAAELDGVAYHASIPVKSCDRTWRGAWTCEAIVRWMKDATGNVQSVLVLGGTSDIAVATVRELVKARARTVVMAVRDPHRVTSAEELRALGATTVETVRFDALDFESHESLAAEVFERTRRHRPRPRGVRRPRRPGATLAGP